jgi:hypothetical protein
MMMNAKAPKKRPKTTTPPTTPPTIAPVCDFLDPEGAAEE